MDYDDIKVIWDSQNEAPLYAVNEAGLRAGIQRQHRAFVRRIFWRDVRDIGIGLVYGAGILVFGGILAFDREDRWRSLLGTNIELSHAEILLLLVAAGLWLFSAGYQFVERRRQEKRARQFESSLRGDLDRTLAHTEHQIRMGKSALWWSVLPVWLSTALFIHILIRLVPTPPGVLILAAIVIPMGFALDLHCKRRPLEAELLPQQRKFETLRRKLMEADRSTI